VKVYENALAMELRKQGFVVQQQAPVIVYYNEAVVGEYFADLIVENKIILELKTAEAISEAHKLQLLNYLKASQIEVGYILNFGSKPTFERRVFTKSPINLKRNPRKSA
jgi:GxxExxY protein